MSRHKILQCDFEKMHIDTTYYDPMIGADVAKLVQPNTKVLFLESPSSLTMEVPDIPAIVKAVRAVSPEIRHYDR